MIQRNKERNKERKEERERDIVREKERETNIRLRDSFKNFKLLTFLAIGKK